MSVIGETIRYQLISNGNSVGWCVSVFLTFYQRLEQSRPLSRHSCLYESSIYCGLLEENNMVEPGPPTAMGQ